MYCINLLKSAKKKAPKGLVLHQGGLEDNIIRIISVLIVMVFFSFS